MTELYWQIGRALNEAVMGGERQAHGSQTLEGLSERLTSEYGRGWSAHHLRQCVRLATVFPDEEILYAVRTKLNWTCIRAVMYIDEPLKRDFYIEMCKLNGWSSRTLQGRIKSMLYELQHFITELGSDFAFLDRQKRITIDGRDYYINLLFFHRRLQRLVAIELKLGDFEASFKGQMELYLHWLERYEMVEGENQPIGLILCSGKNDEHVELLGLDEGNIRVAEYITQLPPMEMLEEKLLLAISRARRRLEE